MMEVLRQTDLQSTLLSQLDQADKSWSCEDHVQSWIDNLTEDEIVSRASETSLSSKTSSESDVVFLQTPGADLDDLMLGAEARHYGYVSIISPRLSPLVTDDQTDPKHHDTNNNDDDDDDDDEVVADERKPVERKRSFSVNSDEKTREKVKRQLLQDCSNYSENRKHSIEKPDKSEHQTEQDDNDVVDGNDRMDDCESYKVDHRRVYSESSSWASSFDKPASLVAALHTDAEELLYSLGFCENTFNIIPSRFFAQPSQAFGIDVEEIHQNMLFDQAEELNKICDVLWEKGTSQDVDVKNQEYDSYQESNSLLQRFSESSIDLTSLTSSDSHSLKHRRILFKSTRYDIPSIHLSQDDDRSPSPLSTSTTFSNLNRLATLEEVPEPVSRSNSFESDQYTQQTIASFLAASKARLQDITDSSAGIDPSRRFSNGSRNDTLTDSINGDCKLSPQNSVENLHAGQYFRRSNSDKSMTSSVVTVINTDGEVIQNVSDDVTFKPISTEKSITLDSFDQSDRDSVCSSSRRSKFSSSRSKKVDVSDSVFESCDSADQMDGVVNNTDQAVAIQAERLTSTLNTALHTSTENIGDFTEPNVDFTEPDETSDTLNISGNVFLSNSQSEHIDRNSVILPNNSLNECDILPNNSLNESSNANALNDSFREFFDRLKESNEREKRSDKSSIEIVVTPPDLSKKDKNEEKTDPLVEKTEEEKTATTTTTTTFKKKNIFSTALNSLLSKYQDSKQSKCNDQIVVDQQQPPQNSVSQAASLKLERINTPSECNSETSSIVSKSSKITGSFFKFFHHTTPAAPTEPNDTPIMTSQVNYSPTMSSQSNNNIDSLHNGIPYGEIDFELDKEDQCWVQNSSRQNITDKLNAFSYETDHTGVRPVRPALHEDELLISDSSVDNFQNNLMSNHSNRYRGNEEAHPNNGYYADSTSDECRCPRTEPKRKRSNNNRKLTKGRSIESSGFDDDQVTVRCPLGKNCTLRHTNKGHSTRHQKLVKNQNCDLCNTDPTTRASSIMTSTLPLSSLQMIETMTSSESKIKMVDSEVSSNSSSSMVMTHEHFDYLVQQFTALRSEMKDEFSHIQQRENEMEERLKHQLSETKRTIEVDFLSWVAKEMDTLKSKLKEKDEEIRRLRDLLNQDTNHRSAFRRMTYS